jgi:LAO/AO transport system kinase
LTVDTLLEGLRTGDIPALARAVSMVENGRPGYEDLLSALYADTGRAQRIGVTGPPGAGKSTLVERLVTAYRETGATVAVVAVDPTSPFTGGALLGDRIRMEAVALDPGVYIRSMASRGGVGGLATTTREVCDVLDAFGFEHIIVETVGVGQSELAIAASADTTVLVLVPESGDGVQVMKAGFMEIADLYVINKADRPGADRLVQDVEVMLGIRRGNAYRHVAAHHAPGQSREAAGASNDPDDWEPPVLKTVARTGDGVADLVRTLGRHRTFLRESGRLEGIRRDRLLAHVREVVNRMLSRTVWVYGDGAKVLENGIDEVVAGRSSPYRLANEIVDSLQREQIHE